jgi:hypothetical protein
LLIMPKASKSNLKSSGRYGPSWRERHDDSQVEGKFLPRNLFGTTRSVFFYHSRISGTLLGPKLT